MIKLRSFVLSPRLNENDACFFLASRFANAPSACTDGVCSNIVKRSAGDIIRTSDDGARIACITAVEIVESFLHGHTPPSLGPVSPLVEGERILREHVLPALELLSFGASVPLESLLTSLALFDAWALGEAARDWRRWRVFTASTLRANLGGAVSYFLTLLMIKWPHVSMRAIETNRAIGAVIRFYFDFAALTGSHTFSEEYLSSLSNSIKDFPVMYRPKHRLDAQSAFRPIAEVPSESGAVLELSDDIELLSQPFSGSADAPLSRIVSVISQWHPSSAQALLAEQIRTSLCPDLSFAFAAPSADPIDPWRQIKMGVTLIDFCSGYVPQSHLSMARRGLATKLHPGQDGMTVKVAGLIAALSASHQPWALGLSRDMSSQHCSAVSRAVLHLVLIDVAVVVPAVDSRFNRIHFKDNRLVSGRVVGRAIGLVLMHGAELEEWRFDPQLARLLHARQRHLLSDLAQITRAIGADDSDSMAQFLEVLVGVDDVLNPGGHDMFTAAEWMSRFGPPEIYY